MGKSTKPWMWALTALLLAASCHTATPPKPGEMAPELSLPDLAGRRWSLKQLRGRMVLLVFWKEGCAICSTRNFQALNQFHRQGGPGGLAVLSVNVGGSKGEVREYVVNQAIKFPVLLDPYARTSKGVYGVTLMPTTYLIDARGMVRERLIGVFDLAALKRLLAAGNKDPAAPSP